MELSSLIQHIDALKTEIDSLRPIDAEQEARQLRAARAAAVQPTA